jgi:hypothetical protein
MRHSKTTLAVSKRHIHWSLGKNRLQGSQPTSYMLVSLRPTTTALNGGKRVNGMTKRALAVTQGDSGLRGIVTVQKAAHGFAKIGKSKRAMTSLAARCMNDE